MENAPGCFLLPSLKRKRKSGTGSWTPHNQEKTRRRKVQKKGNGKAGRNDRRTQGIRNSQEIIRQNIMCREPPPLFEAPPLFFFRNEPGTTGPGHSPFSLSQNQGTGISGIFAYKKTGRGIPCRKWLVGLDTVQNSSRIPYPRSIRMRAAFAPGRSSQMIPLDARYRSESRADTGMIFSVSSCFNVQRW